MPFYGATIKWLSRNGGLWLSKEMMLLNSTWVLCMTKAKESKEILSRQVDSNACLEIVTAIAGG